MGRKLIPSFAILLLLIFILPDPDIVKGDDCSDNSAEQHISGSTTKKPKEQKALDCFKQKVDKIDYNPEGKHVKEIDKALSEYQATRGMRVLTPETDPLGYYGISVGAGVGRLSMTDNITKVITVRYDVDTRSESSFWHTSSLPRPNIWVGYGLDEARQSQSNAHNIKGHAYLIGVGFGFGTFTGGNTSVVSLDFGLGAYDGFDWKKNEEYYFGVNIDARLLPKLLEAFGTINK